VQVEFHLGHVAVENHGLCLGVCVIGPKLLLVVELEQRFEITGAELEYVILAQGVAIGICQLARQGDGIDRCRLLGEIHKQRAVIIVVVGEDARRLGQDRDGAGHEGRRIHDGRELKANRPVRPGFLVAVDRVRAGDARQGHGVEGQFTRFPQVSFTVSRLCLGGHDCAVTDTEFEDLHWLEAHLRGIFVPVVGACDRFASAVGQGERGLGAGLVHRHREGHRYRLLDADVGRVLGSPAKD